MAKQFRKPRAKPAPAAAAPIPAQRSGPSPELRAIAEKKRRGERLTLREQAKFDKAAREQDEILRDQHYRTMPRRKWQLASGVSHHVMMKHAGRYGIPLADETLDVKAIANWLHTFLNDNEAALASGKDVDLLMVGDSPALERYRLATAKLKELELAEKLRDVIKRDEVHTRLARVSAAHKNFREKLERQLGRDALDWFEQAIDIEEREAEQLAK